MPGVFGEFALIADHTTLKKVTGTSPVYDFSAHFSVEGKAASIEDQSWFPF